MFRRTDIRLCNWLIIAGAIAVFVWQTFSIQEREAQLPAMTAKYEKVPVEDMAKELRVKDYQLAAIEKKAEEIQKKIDKLTESIDESVPSKNKKADQREQFKERFVKESILQQFYVWGEIRPYILDGLTLKGLFGHMWLHGGIMHLFGNMLFFVDIR